MRDGQETGKFSGFVVRKKIKHEPVVTVTYSFFA
jgi:hypothetical protein